MSQLLLWFAGFDQLGTQPDVPPIAGRSRQVGLVPKRLAALEGRGKLGL